MRFSNGITHKTLLFILIFFLNIEESFSQNNNKMHAISVFGDIKYDKNFEQFDYVNSDAPKGGKIKLAERGTYDSLNQFLLKGLPAIGLDYIYESLLKESFDEPLTAYGLLAESLYISEDKSSVTFFLRNNAKWHDNTPITAEDVVWTFNNLLENGHPYFKSYYSDISNVEFIDMYTVKFHFSNKFNRELPIIIGQMKILPKHFWQNKNFASSGLTIPLGSGPYQIDSFVPGKSITYKRVYDHWGQNLPVYVGQNNFDYIQYDYYRDNNVMIEALKSKEYYFRHENISKEWATSYNEVIKNKNFIKEEISHELPQGMQAFVYNTRKNIFKNIILRKALSLAFDFEWTNKTLFYGQYFRTKSYFSNSDLASSGLPKENELQILNKFQNQLSPEIYNKQYNPGETDGSGNNRKNLRTALKILKEGNYKLVENVLFDPDGNEVKFEILLLNPAFERIVAPFIKNLAKLGVKASIRIVDTAQYKNRLDNFEFDMVVMARGQSLTPGNEQKNFWSSESADIPGSLNWIGIKNPIVDELINLLINAQDRKTLKVYAKALDRVLLNQHYVIPHWHIKLWRLAYWNDIKRPKNLPKYNLGFPEIWWYNN